MQLYHYTTRLYALKSSKKFYGGGDINISVASTPYSGDLVPRHPEIDANDSFLRFLQHKNNSYFNTAELQLLLYT